MMKGGANPTDILEIKELATAGWSPKAISLELQIPRKTVESFYPGLEAQLEKEKIKKAKKAAKKRQKIIDDYEAGKTPAGVDEISPQQRGANTRKERAEAARSEAEEKANEALPEAI